MVIEAADQNTLMKINGKYAQMFRMQEERYRRVFN